MPHKEVLSRVRAGRAGAKVQVDGSADVPPPDTESVVFGQELLVSDEGLKEGNREAGLCTRSRRVLENKGFIGAIVLYQLFEAPSSAKCESQATVGNSLYCAFL
jgi:hypothetical protein